MHVRGHLLQAGHHKGEDDDDDDDDDDTDDDDNYDDDDDDDDLGAATSWHMWDTNTVFLASAKQN